MRKSSFTANKPVTSTIIEQYLQPVKMFLSCILNDSARQASILFFIFQDSMLQFLEPCWRCCLSIDVVCQF